MSEPSAETSYARPPRSISLKPPGKLNYEASNMAKEWRAWKEELELYAKLAMREENDASKIELLKYLIGPEGREVFKTLTMEGTEGSRTLKNVTDAFDKHYDPKKSETVERFKFFTRNQESGESFERYYTELKKMSRECNFGELRDSLIKDRIVCGIHDQVLQQRLLREESLTLEKCEKICRASEISKEQSKTIESQDLHAFKNQTFKTDQCRGKKPQSEKPNKQGEKDSYNASTAKCKYCGYTHEFKKEKCPAYGKQCNKCKGNNHFARVCHKQQKANVHTFESSEEDSDSDYLNINSIELVNSIEKPHNYPRHIFAKMQVEGKVVRFQLDSGATCNTIPAKYVDITKNKLVGKGQKLSMYNNTTIKTLGTVNLKFINLSNGKKYKAEFVVLDGPAMNPILGNRAIQQMGLVEVKYENICSVDTPLTADQLKKEYPDVFEGTGLLEGKYHIELDTSVRPVVHPPRKVPVALKQKLKKELDQLVEKHMIAPVSEPTPWVSSLVIVDKPNKLRVCIDPRDLNKAINRSHYPLPTIEDILPDLSKAKVFSVLDAKNGFWHIELDEESSYLTTFNTPFGRFRWLRMPMGISSGPEEYQRRQDQALEGLKNVRSVADDILVFGEGDSIEEATQNHDRALHSLMQRCREKNLKLNLAKLKLRLNEVPFIGHLVTDSGLKPDPEKVRAVLEMPNPSDVAGVLRFVGFTNYLSKFIPNLSEVCEPLRQLTQKDIEWHWESQHEQAILAVKKQIAAETTLRYYDSSKELTLQCDASDSGLGAALIQDGGPIAYASRTMTDTERRYAQIEKELLAVTFGLEKFHQYTYGRKVIVHSDHKPLEIIMKKSLHAAPKRLQRMLLRLQVYDIDLCYKPGKELWLADTLSRAPLHSTAKSPVEEHIEHVNMVQYLPISEPRLREIRQHTEDDVILQTLKSVIIQGWPDWKESAPPLTLPYYSFRDELTVQNGIVFKGNRAVIPKSLRLDMIHRIHASHLGIEGCLRRARECLFWPGMNAEIKDFIGKCETCRTFENKQQKESLIPHDVPVDRPWAKVGTDLFTYKDSEYLITVDYFSSFWEIDHLHNTKSQTVVRKLKAHFARYGIPDTVMSDNGPQFDSREFKEFAQSWQFDHSTSSPNYPQSNGKVERAVREAKKVIRKANKSKSDLHLAILDHRNTPMEGLDSSPAQCLMSRRTKTLLPTHGNLLKPQVVENVSQKLIRNKARQAEYYNHTARDLKPLEPGDIVRIQPSKYEKEWQRGEVKRQVDTRSYEVVTENHSTLRRNRRHLRKSSEPMAPPQDFEEGRSPNNNTTSPDETPSNTGETVVPHDNPGQQELRRSGRERNPPSYLEDYQR